MSTAPNGGLRTVHLNAAELFQADSVLRWRYWSMAKAVLWFLQEIRMKKSGSTIDSVLASVI